MKKYIPDAGGIYREDLRRQSRRGEEAGKGREKIMKTLACILGISAVVLFTGCSLNYKDARVLEELEDSVPNIVMTGLTHRVSSNGKIIMKMSAEKSEGYEKRKKTVLTQVVFSEYDGEGNVLTEGRADRVVYFSDTKNAEIDGNIRVHSFREKGAISANRLSWNDAQRTLRGEEGGEVVLIDDDGSRVSGKGFEADLKRLILSFTGPAEGELVVTDAE